MKTNTQAKKNTDNLYIFNKYINNNSKLIPFNVNINNSGEIKYLPPFSKEWKNSIYVFNFNNLKNLPLYNININTLIKNYFNLYFNYKFIFGKYKSPRSNRKSLNKIFTSQAEIKHTNSKAVVTVYTYNREKRILQKKIQSMFKKFFFNKILLLFYDNSKIYKNITNSFLKKTILILLHKELILLRRFKLKYNLNKYKFEEQFLYKLNRLISKFYNKKIEFNIVNMKSIILNSDFFTQILSLKLKNQKARIIRLMNIILNKIKLPKVNKVKEKSIIKKMVNFNLINNKYKNLHLNYITGTSLQGQVSNVDKLFNDLYYNVKRQSLDYKKIYETIFNLIKYKNVGGIRLEIKGRLTRRYRADKALYKAKWKGGLKNIDSSYKGLSSVNLRGFIKPNMEYSISRSKRRIGVFAVKGWISGK